MRWAVAALCLLLWLGSGMRRASAEDRYPPWHDSDPEALEIQLVTFGPGDAIHQYFGHNGMVVRDTQLGFEAMYNFGMFGFGPDMLPKYLQGRLEFWAAATPVRSTYARYAADDRSVRVLDLELSPVQRMRLARRLAHFVEPENRYYRYDHYRDNCSTKLRDLLNEALDGQLLRAHEKPARFDYRGHTWRYTEHDLLVHMLLILWMNDSMERPIRAYDQAFLPGELERMVEHTQITDATGRTLPLVKRGYTLYEARRPPVPEQPSPRVPFALGLGALIGLCLLGIGLALRRTEHALPRLALGLLHTLIGLALGLPGLVAGLFVLTEWEVTYWNESLWFANPLSALGLFAGPALMWGSARARRVLGVAAFLLLGSSLLYLVLKALPAFNQQAWVPYALYAPINLGFAAAHWLWKKRVPWARTAGTG